MTGWKAHIPINKIILTEDFISVLPLDMCWTWVVVFCACIYMQTEDRPQVWTHGLSYLLDDHACTISFKHTTMYSYDTAWMKILYEQLFPSGIPTPLVNNAWSIQGFNNQKTRKPGLKNESVRECSCRSKLMWTKV